MSIRGWSVLVLLLVTVVCRANPAAAQQADDNRPNIVWIFVEDMNGWYGCYGDDTVPTPHLDALATRGVRFDRAYMPAGVCSATRSAIALGAMQTSLGVHNHRSSRRRTPGEEIFLPDGVSTVYQRMRDAGYYVTSNQGKNDFNFIFAMDDLYDRVVPGMGLRNDQHWADCPQGQPFFAQIQLRGGKNSGNGVPPTDPADVTLPPYYPDHPVYRREYAHHYNTIRQTDNEVGQIITALAEDDLLDNTVVIFWTDHGMRLYRHKQWLYEGGIRVPLIIAGPSDAITPNSSRDDLVSGIDITATTLALAGVDLEDLSWVEGRDFFADDYEERQFVISARDRCDYTIERVRAVTTERFKYIRNFMTDRPFMQPQYRDGNDYIEVARRLNAQDALTPAQAFPWSQTRVPEELYDLANDPHEINNLADDPDYADALAQHRAILEQWIAVTGDQGQHPESDASLRGVLQRWGDTCVNPEYDRLRQAE